MITFKQIDEARKLLDLGEEATLHEIKEAYKKLAFKHHPDKSRTFYDIQEKDKKVRDKHKGKDKKESEEIFKRMTHARDVLLNYCASYRYSFKESDVKKATMDKEFYEHLKRFYDGWWGKLDL